MFRSATYSRADSLINDAVYLLVDYVALRMTKWKKLPRPEKAPSEKVKRAIAVPEARALYLRFFALLVVVYAGAATRSWCLLESTFIAMQGAPVAPTMRRWTFYRLTPVFAVRRVTHTSYQCRPEILQKSRPCTHVYI